MIIARSPLRISFGGGGTDLPAYYERYGGMVVSAAIQAACHVELATQPGRDVTITSNDFNRSITISARAPIVVEEPLSLPRAVLAWFAGRGERPAGMHLTMRADVPPGTGLGSSSAMTAALIAAIARSMDLPLTQRMIAEAACDVEIDILQRPIGRQDQYASALGGINTLTFSMDAVAATPLRLPAAVERTLQAHLLLLSTRKTHDSGRLLQTQRDASATDGAVIQRLHRIKDLAGSMRGALHQGDMETFGSLLDASWQLKRGITEGVTTTRIDHWYQTARDNGAFGGKICGAGGGGFMLFCVPPDRRASLTTALVREGLAPFPVHFDRQGCITHGDTTASEPWASHSLKGTAHEIVNAGQL